MRGADAGVTLEPTLRKPLIWPISFFLLPSAHTPPSSAPHTLDFANKNLDFNLAGFPPSLFLSSSPLVQQIAIEAHKRRWTLALLGSSQHLLASGESPRTSAARPGLRKRAAIEALRLISPPVLAPLVGRCIERQLPSWFRSPSFGLETTWTKI